MKKLFIVLLLLTALFVTPISFAQSNFRSEEVSTLSKNETINKDYFATGEKVTLSGTVNGDAYLAGGNIIVDSTINGDLLVAGGNVNINGRVNGDIRAIGGSIMVDGEVAGNITTLGGSVRVDDDSDVAGSLVAGAGNVEVFGPIGKGMTVGAGALTIGNKVGSDVVAGVEELDLTSTASISGNLNYLSQKAATVANGASISGTTKHDKPPKEVEEKENFVDALNFGWTIFKFLSSLAIGLLLLFGVPVFMQKVAGAVVNRPLGALGVGLLFLVITPIIAVILAVTVVGIPLALLVMVGYFFLIYIAKIFVSLAIGERILGAKANKIWSLVLGLGVFAVISLVPVIGGLVEFVALLLGIGASVMTKKDMYTNLRSKKLL